MFVQRVGITSFVVRWLGAQAATPYKGHVRHAICMGIHPSAMGHRCSESFAGSRTFKWRGKHHAILPSFTLAAPLRRKKSDKFPQTHAYRTALNRLGSNESFLGNGQVGSVVTTAGIPCAGGGINIWPSFFQWDNFSPGLNL